MQKRFNRKRKSCYFCKAENVKNLDYKNISILKRFINDRGRILPRRATGTCAKHQRKVTTEIKRARYVALLPYTSDHFNN